MGYLIENIDIIKTTVTIPSADVQVMDVATPFTILSTNNLFVAAPVACFFKIEANQTTPYIGFNHIHLTNSNNYSVGELCATYAINASILSDLQSNAVYSMLCNFQASPNRFGGFNTVKNIEIFFDIAPTAGDGDMTVILYYTRITI
jgi:hypothetical protein